VPLLEEKEQLTLASYIISELSIEDKTVRDPVHKDILWNHLETRVIDTEAFQRLRRIKQLGTAHFVYPGAEHSRFQHSLGTLHMAKILLQSISNNRFSGYRSFGKTPTQDMMFQLVVRLAALLHDVHEFPLSHTLEKEGSIFPRQWKEKTFNRKILGKESEIFKAISEYILELLGPEETAKVLKGQPSLTADDKKALAERLTKTIIAFVYKFIKGRKARVSDISEELFGDKDILKKLMDKRFLVAGNQLILNTICADLLDYLPRDFYFCGIRKTYDERFLKYATISDYLDEKRRSYPVFAYNLVSKRNELKHSVLSSLFDTLELRYTLAEFVHTHRTKNAFSVMAIEAFNHYYQSLDVVARQNFEKKMMEMGDDDMLIYIRDQNTAARHILEHYFKRRPYREYILCSYKAIEEDPNVRTSLKDRLQNPRERLFLERLLTKWLNYDSAIANLQEGDCLIYTMPDPGRLFKELKTNIIYIDQEGKKKVGTLLSLTTAEKDYGPMSRPMKAIMERTIMQRGLLIKKYKNLWHASLFISPDVDSSKIQPVASELIEKFFRLANCDFEVEAPKVSALSKELGERLLALAQDKRGFATFEQIFNST